jgi:hypothetical protein
MTMFHAPLLIDGKDPLAWLDQADSAGVQLDPTLRDLDFDVRKNPIEDGDTRPYCQAIVGKPGFERLCSRHARPDERFCGTHIRHRRPVELFGAER